MRAPVRWSWVARWSDPLTAAVIFLELELESWIAHRPGAAAVAMLLVVPVLFRRRWPTGALLASGVVTGALVSAPAHSVVLGMFGPVLPVIAVSFTAGAQVEVRRGLPAALAVGVLLTSPVLLSGIAPTRMGSSLGSEVVTGLGLPLTSWALGWLWGDHARRERASRELVAQIEAERELSERDSVTQERLRISRELQDVIAQNVSAIVVQAGGARQLIGSDPDGATGAMRSVERAAREALADLRRTLGLLRTEEDPQRLAPQPGLREIGSLLASAHEGGVECSLRIEGEPVPLPLGTDLVAYRVIEAALRAADAGSDPSELLLAYGGNHLDIEIAALPSTSDLDVELRGIAQRVAIYGGVLDVTPTGSDRYQIRARVPREVVGW